MKKTTPATLNRSAVRARASEVICWSRLEDDDEDSHIVRTTNSLFRGSRGAIAESESGWYRIRIPSGYKYHKEYFLTELRRHIYPMKLTPYCWRTEKTRAQFYVDDFKVAAILAQADRTIDQPDGCKLQIIVEPAEPYYKLNNNLKENMVKAMETRYDAKTNLLDLNKFFAHEQLRNDYCPLNRPTILLAAIETIAEKIPDLMRLTLNNNKITSLHFVKDLEKKLPRLEVLHLADNLINSTGSLQFINQTNIVELVLTGNPFRKRYSEDAVYVSDIRKHFPKLRIVDGIELPPQIGFDIGVENVELPSPKFTFYVDAAGDAMAKLFLVEYFSCYDSGNRQQLEIAYHDRALFSLTAKFDKLRLSEYQQFNRSLNYIHEFEPKMIQLKNGTQEIISFLSKLPATKHDPRSCTVDLMLYTENLILITVTGIFCEMDDQQIFSLKPEFMRSFHRSFVITRKIDGRICIINDMLHVNNLTRAQEKTAFTDAARTYGSTPDLFHEPDPAAMGNEME